MATISQDNITFSNYNDSDIISVSSPLKYGSYEGLDEDNYGIVNAVDIAWNGAEVDEETTINSTGELLNYIKGAYSSGGGSGFDPTELQNAITQLSTRVAVLEGILNNVNGDELRNVITFAPRLAKHSDNTVTVTYAKNNGANDNSPMVLKKYVDDKIDTLSTIVTNLSTTVNTLSNSKLDKTAISYSNETETLTVNK